MPENRFTEDAEAAARAAAWAAAEAARAAAWAAAEAARAAAEADAEADEQEVQDGGQRCDLPLYH